MISRHWLDLEVSGRNASLDLFVPAFSPDDGWTYGVIVPCSSVGAPPRVHREHCDCKADRDPIVAFAPQFTIDDIKRAFGIDF